MSSVTLSLFAINVTLPALAKRAPVAYAYLLHALDTGVDLDVPLVPSALDELEQACMLYAARCEIGGGGGVRGRAHIVERQARVRAAAMHASNAQCRRMRARDQRVHVPATSVPLPRRAGRTRRAEHVAARQRPRRRAPTRAQTKLERGSERPGTLNCLHLSLIRTKRPTMSFCDRCGSLYKVEEASGAAAAIAVEGLVARCTGCNRCENVRAAFDKGIRESFSTSDTFLFKYGIEPMNPDGSKFGAVKDVTRERAVVDEKCPKCSHKGLNFYTMQLRSVDEGQTVFDECPKCGHTFSQNN